MAIECCRNCMFVRKEDRFFGSVYYCILMKTNEQGLKRSVSPNGCCNRFSEDYTLENSGYKVKKD